MTRPLTAHGLKAILTRAGVDHPALEIRDDQAVWTDVETGQRSTSVVASGPREGCSQRPTLAGTIRNAMM